MNYLAGKRVRGLNSERVGDSLGSSVDGTPSGGVTQNAVGKVGSYGWSFDGSNDYVTCGTTSDFKLLHDGTNNTVSFWVYRNGSPAGSEPCIIDTQGASSSYTGLSIYFDTSGNIWYYVSDGSGSDTKSVGCGNATDGAWTHILITNDGTNLTAYRNGSQNAQTSLSGFTPSTGNHSYALTFGKNARSGALINASIDDCSIFNRALSSSEIASLYNSGNGATIPASGISTTGLKAYYNFEQTSGNLTNIASALVKVQNGTIFEETDTNKSFIYNSSTSSWTQI